MQDIKKKKRVAVKRSSAGLGLFAVVDFKKGEFVIEYTGEKVRNRIVEERNSKYIFALNAHFSIDGAGRENMARYINHSCRPNCEAVIKRSHIIIYARKNIKAGEELNYDYGSEYFNEYIKPFGCRCVYCQTKKTNA